MWQEKFCGFLLEDFQIQNVRKNTIILEDNIPAINLAQNEQTKGRTKHISIKTRFVYENIQFGNIHIEHIGSSNNLADCFKTKALFKRIFTQQRNLIVFSSESSGIRGGVGKRFVEEILNKRGCTSGLFLKKIHFKGSQQDWPKRKRVNLHSSGEHNVYWTPRNNILFYACIVFMCMND